jgi:hypothetical protein
MARLFGSIALAGPLASLGRSETAAKKKRCPPCKKRKKGTCKKKRPNGTPCPGGTCQGGRCVAATGCRFNTDCPGGLVCLDAQCICLNDAHCAATQVCARGACVVPVCRIDSDCPGSCSCERDVEGTAGCIVPTIGNCTIDCTINARCISGFCQASNHCGENRKTCAARCPEA